MRREGGAKMETAHAFSKAVTSSVIHHQPIADFGQIGRIAEVVERLERLDGAETVDFSDIDLMRSNPRSWISSIVCSRWTEGAEDRVRYLLTDFTDNMKTRMRELDKYVIGIVMASKLVLCHSESGGHTIITPEWDIITRMLDTDNVIRFVSFTNCEDGIITVWFWERYSTESFVTWLGLKRKRGFRFAGPYDIRSEIEGMTVDVQLDDKEMDDLIVNHQEFAQGRIKLQNPVRELHVEAVRVGAQKYSSDDFIQVHQAQKYGVSPYRMKYDQLMKDRLPLFQKYRDEEHQLVLVNLENGELTVAVRKELRDIHILFTNEDMEIAGQYLGKLASRFVNNETTTLFHAGCAFRDRPVKVGNFAFLNSLTVDELTGQVAGFYDSLRLVDGDLDLVVRYFILHRLSEANVALPVAHFLQRLCGQVHASIRVQSQKWTKAEDDLIEYKPADLLTGKDRDVIRELADDAYAKLSGCPVKLYIIGVEDDGSLRPVPSSRISSDRMNTWSDGVKEALMNKGLDATVYPCLIRTGQGYLVLIAFRCYSH